jgi:small GTP-binding protein
MEYNRKEKPLNIVILGAGAVGKSAITIRMTQDIWQCDYNPTIEDNYGVTMEIDGQQESLDILDTAGQEQFAALRDHWIREAKGILLVYTICSKRTLDHCGFLYKKITRQKIAAEETVAIVLVGNKCDLPASEREVTYDEGKSVADSWDVPFLETSALTGDYIIEAFEILVKACKTNLYEEKKQLEIEPAPQPGGMCDSCCIL